MSLSSAVLWGVPREAPGRLDAGPIADDGCHAAGPAITPQQPRNPDLGRQ